jgi:hypothetical protein
LHAAQPLAEKAIGAERDEERRSVEKHHRAGRRGKAQAFEDQHEFEAEDEACQQAGTERAVALEHFYPAQPRSQQQHRQRQDRSDRRLQHRRDVGQRELDRDLVERPGTAQHQHQCDGARAQRTPGG